MKSQLVFPASAGMIRPVFELAMICLGVPCIRGDDPQWVRWKRFGLSCSLHPRG